MGCREGRIVEDKKNGGVLGIIIVFVAGAVGATCDSKWKQTVHLVM